METETSFQIQTLYGVLHGMKDIPRMETLGNPPRHVLPSSDLIINLLKLTQGTQIGTETLNPREAAKLNLDPESGSEYWEDIHAKCRYIGLEVVHLDDYSLLQQVANKWLIAESLQQEIIEIRTEFAQASQLSSTQQKTRCQRVLALEEATFAAHTEGEYSYVVRREEKIMKNIVSNGSPINLIGRGHADFLMLNQQLLQRLGITVINYQREEQKLYGGLPGRYLLLSSNLPDPRELIERESLLRRYQAVTTGRIMSNGIPDYIGTWRTWRPSEGLFELYVTGELKNGDVVGVIEDQVGTADFRGKIGQRVVRFTKSYRPQLEKTARPIYYSGRFTQNAYRGIYPDYQLGGLESEFFMVPGPQLPLGLI